AKAKPIEATLPDIVEINYARLYRLAFIFGVFLALIGLFISIYEYISKPFNYPFLSYIGVFLIIFGFTFVAPLYLKGVLGVVEKFIKVAFKFVGVIATGDIRGSLHRFSVALISVMISSALIISFFILIHSFEKNLTDWIDKNLNFDVFIKASSCSSNFCFTPLSKKLIGILEDFDEVEDVNKFRVLRGYYRDRPVLLGFGNEDIVKKHTDHVINLGIRKKKELAASEYFRIKYGIEVGDYMNISTPMGKIRFRVREIFKSYSTTTGFLVFDRYWLKKLWSLDDATQLNIYLKKGASTKEFIDKLKSNIPKNLNVDIYDNKSLKKRVLQIFDRTFAITYAIQIIAFIISLIGMINTIFTVIVEKFRSISILRYIGCSYKKIKLIFITSASVVGFAGIIIGALLGAIISFIMIKIVNIVSFGWTIDIFIPFISILGLLFLLYVTIIISVFLPISYIKKIDVKESINT
ncbi:MAG: FtsX-like permease family protein, partial [Deferribacterota bacterium]|nr:FtsX-like permease family protein [Deferribacterota bacterium]